MNDLLRDKALEALILARRAIEPLTEAQIKLHFIPRDTADRLENAITSLRAAAPVVTVKPNSQEWRGMSGATAFQLIERHADNWADTDLMMGEWLQANAAAPVVQQGVSDEQIDNVWFKHANLGLMHFGHFKEAAYSILSLAQAAPAGVPLSDAPQVQQDAKPVALSAADAAFLAARLRRLFKHFDYPLPAFAQDDASLIGIAGSAIGAVLAASPTAPAPAGEQK